MANVELRRVNIVIHNVGELTRSPAKKPPALTYKMSRFENKSQNQKRQQLKVNLICECYLFGES